MYRSYYIPLKEFKQKPENYNSNAIHRICRSQILSKKFMREMKDWLDWEDISQYQKLDEEFMREMKDKIDWRTLCGYNKKVYLSEFFMEEMEDYVDWYVISRFRSFSEDFMLRHLDKLCPDRIQENHHMYDITRHFEKFATPFLKYNRNSFSWDSWSYYNISIDFVREYADVIKFDKIIPIFISGGKGLKFVEEFSNYFDDQAWARIENRLYEFDFDFIIKYSDKWKYLSYTNPVSGSYYGQKNYTEEQKEIINKLWESKQ